MKRFFYRGSYQSQCGLFAYVSGFFSRESKPTREELTQIFWDDGKEAFLKEGQPNPVLAELISGRCDELPSLPHIDTETATLPHWRIEVGFVCHDIKFGGDTSGVFAWPEEPSGYALESFIRVLLTDIIVVRGDSPEYADYTDVLSSSVSSTTDPVTHN